LDEAAEFQGNLVDVQGRLVQQFNNTLSAGTHRIDLQLEAYGISDGVYFLMLNAGGRMTTKRIVVQR
jgi:hypothetical protein